MPGKPLMLRFRIPAEPDTVARTLFAGVSPRYRPLSLTRGMDIHTPAVRHRPETVSTSGNILIGVRILPARLHQDTLRTGASFKAHVKKYKTIRDSRNVLHHSAMPAFW